MARTKQKVRVCILFRPPLTFFTYLLFSPSLLSLSFSLSLSHSLSPTLSLSLSLSEGDLSFSSLHLFLSHSPSLLTSIPLLPPSPFFHHRRLLKITQPVVPIRSARRDINLVPLLFKKFANIRSQLISFFSCYPSLALSGRLRIAFPWIHCAGQPKRCYLFRKHLSISLLGYLKTPSCVPSMPSVSRLCPRTCSSLVASADLSGVLLHTNNYTAADESLSHIRSPNPSNQIKYFCIQDYQ